MSFTDPTKGLLWNGSQGSDVWDDRALIDAYDKAVKQVNQRIADKCLQSTDKSANNCGNARKAANGQTWHSGQYCRCAYSEDGVEYEAQIISIDKSDETCIVRYIGYGNEEQKALKELKTSLGKRCRRIQCQHSDTQELNESNSDTDYDNCSVNNTAQNESNIDYSRPKHPLDGPPSASWFMPPPASHSGGVTNSSSRPIVPPPLPFCSDSSVGSDDESLASMLMSWYMSGYHTGYYRALKHSRHCCHKCNK